MSTTDPEITDTHPLRPLFPATAHSITVTTLGLTAIILTCTLLSAPCSSAIRARYPGMALCAFIGGLIWLQSESEWTQHPLHLVPFVSSSTQLSCSPLAQFVFGLPMWLAAMIVPLIQFYSRAYLATHDSSNVWPTVFLLPALLLPGALLLRFVDITQGTCTTLFLDDEADYALQQKGHHNNDDETCCLKEGWTVVLVQLCLLYVSLYAWLMMKLWAVREQVSWFKHHVMLGVGGLLVAICHIVVYVYAAITSSHEVYATRNVGQTAQGFLMVLDTLLITIIPVWSRFLPIVSSCSCCCEPDHARYGPRSTAASTHLGSTGSGGSYSARIVPNAVHAEHTTSPAGAGHYDAPPPYTPALPQDRHHRQHQSPAYGAIAHVQPGTAHADSSQHDPPPYTPSPNVRRFPRHSRQSIPDFSDPPTEQSSLLTPHQLQQQQYQQQPQHRGHRPAPAAPNANNPSPTAPPVPHHLLRLFQPPEDVRAPGVIHQQHLAPPPPPPPSPPPLQSQPASHQQHSGHGATSPNMLQLESIDDDVTYGRRYYSN